MASDTKVHMGRVRFYEGLRPNESRFADLQNNAYDAIKRVQQRFLGGGASFFALLAPLAYSIAAGFVVNVTNNAGIAPSGLSVDWETTQVFTATSATHGSYIGTTAPAAAQKRYIVLAVAHTVNETTPEVSEKTGLTYNYDLQSKVQLRVYALSADVALADDWKVNATLATLFDTIVAADCIPLAICERRDGTTTFDAGDIHAIEHVLAPAGTPLKELQALREFMGRGFLGFVLNDAGTVAGAGEAVPGTPGRINVTGGESVLLGLSTLGTSGKYRPFTIRKATVPVTSISFGALNTEYTVRMKLDPVTGAASVYAGTGEWPNDSYPGPFTTGTSGGSNQGFSRTALDIPLFKVVTGASNGDLPTVTAISNLAGGQRSTLDVVLGAEVGTGGGFLAGSSLQALLQAIALGDFPFEGETDFSKLVAQSIKITQTSASDILNSASVAPLQTVVSNDTTQTWKLLYSGKLNDYNQRLNIYIEKAAKGSIAFVFNAFWSESGNEWTQTATNTSMGSHAIIFGSTGIKFYTVPATSSAWDEWGTDPSFSTMELTDSGLDSSLLKRLGIVETQQTKTDVIAPLAATSPVEIRSTAINGVGLHVRNSAGTVPYWMDSLNTPKIYAHLTRAAGVWTVRKDKQVASATDSASSVLVVTLDSALLTNDPYPIITCQQVAGPAAFLMIAARTGNSTFSISKFNPATGSPENWANSDGVVVTILGSTAE